MPHKTTTKTITSLEEPNKSFPHRVEQDTLWKAIKNYLSKGGVIRFKEAKDQTKIVYPTKKTLELKIKEKGKILQTFKVDYEQWLRRLKKAENYELTTNLKKFSHPVYWQHMAKYYSDPDYKADADSVSLPVHLVADTRWKPMVEMFVTNIEYRKQLTETVQNSVAYSENRAVARFAKKQNEFRKEECKRKVNDLNGKIKKLTEEITYFNAMKGL